MMQVVPLEHVFKEKFNFHTEQYEIPPTDSEKSLFNRLQAFTRCYDSPSKLGIVYYGGHADRKQNEEGVDLELFAKRSRFSFSSGGISRTNTSLSEISVLESPTDTTASGKFDISGSTRPQQPHISYKAICEQFKTSETDILLIVDSCFAAGAFTNQPFGGRKCELFCSIAESNYARAPGQPGSFTERLTKTLADMIEKIPEGFSTSDLYREIYQQQHATHKPFHFIQSRYDFGRIWLRPCQKKEKVAPPPDESQYTIDLRFHLAKSLDLMKLNHVVKALQHIPHVQMVNMQNMHSPHQDLDEFLRTVYLANRMRPVLARARRKIELKRARELCRTDSSPPSPSAATSERFHVQEPRDVGLFDWSSALAVTPRSERLTSDEYFHSKKKTPLKLENFPGRPAMADAALQLFNREDQPLESSGPVSQLASKTRLSQRTLDGLFFFGMGVLAPTVIGWAVQRSASLFAAR